MTLQQLAAAIDAQLEGGDGQAQVWAVVGIEEAGPGQVTFVANPKYVAALATTNAAAVIVGRTIRTERPGLTLLRASEPYLAFAKAAVALHGFRQHPFAGVHPAAHVDPTATVGQGTVIYPGAFVGPRARVGRDCILYPNAVVYDDCILGDRVTLHANTSVGQDGFGYATHDGVHHKIPQAGNVVIEDDVEIGANCSIDRAAVGSTVIGRGSKFSNNVVIGHGSKIGPYALIVAQTGVAGSTTIGHHATIAGQAGITGHLRIGNNVTIAARSMVADDVPDQTAVLGAPAIALARGRRVAVLTNQLPELLDRIRQLEHQVAELASIDERKAAADRRRE